MKTIIAEKPGTKITSHRTPAAAIYLAARLRKEGYEVKVKDREP